MTYIIDKTEVNSYFEFCNLQLVTLSESIDQRVTRSIKKLHQNY